uniref:Chromosome 3 open reading frame 38 n=1 Tax=Callithrix jacchus TaxID=9483 RepID=H9KWN1_CALJA
DSGTSLRPQPGTSSGSTSILDRPLWRLLPPRGLEYSRPSDRELLGRHFRCLLPRRRPAGRQGRRCCRRPAPPSRGSTCRDSALQRWRAAVNYLAYWTTTRSWPCATPSPTAWCSLRAAKQVKEDKKAENVDFHRLGEEFCHWFFGLLNSQNPFLGPPQDEWGPQHFWHDVKLRFYYNTSEQNVMDYHGAEIVSLRLLSLVKEEFLFLSPNLDSRGLKCASSPHGLVMVGVAGTVHRGNTCLGIFEQIFGLIRCPFVENTWKIKFINLRIVGESSLVPGTLPKPAVTFEQSDLESFYNVITLCGTNEVRHNVKQALESGTDQA